MKLHEVPKNTWVRSIEPDCSDEFKFHHIDGMFVIMWLGWKWRLLIND